MENVSVDLKRHGFISVICKTLGIIAAIVFVLIAFPKKLSADVTLIDSGERADYRYEFYSDGELKLYGKFTEPKDIYDLYLEVDFQLKHSPPLKKNTAFCCLPVATDFIPSLTAAPAAQYGAMWFISLSVPVIRLHFSTSRSSFPLF